MEDTVELAMNRIHQGDCIERMKQLPAGIVDLAFADPPFNIGYEYDVYDDKKNYHAYLKWTGQWMAEVCRLLKADGTFWIAIGDEYAAEIKVLAQNDLNLHCRSWVIWYYTFGVNCTKKFTRSHAHLFHFVKDRQRFCFNEDELCVPSARQLVYADNRADPAGRLPDDTWVLRPQDLPEGFKAHETTWFFSRVAGTFKERSGFHGCQMPEQLLGRIIRASSRPGELVLDPFAGTGSTLVVAKKLGRRWLGFEMSADYATRAGRRVAQAHEEEPLRGAPEPVVSAPKTPGRASALFLRAGVQRALIEAYLVASKGWSTDRVIADPELNETFVQKCREFGLFGSPADWNRALLSLRKAGQLSGAQQTRRTSFSTEAMDAYLFAVEIAIRQVSDETGKSLDEILCDPSQASQFDSVAKRWAPGFQALHYRWAALALRKRARKCRRLALEVEPQLTRRRFDFRPFGSIRIETLTRIPGLYLARTEQVTPLYVGETLDLAARLQVQSNAVAWRSELDRLQIGVMKLENVDREQRLGLHSWFIAEKKPELNYLGLAIPSRANHTPRNNGSCP